MTIHEKIIISICVIFLIFAVYFEYADGHHSYRFTEKKNTDKLNTSLRKIKTLLKCDTYSIKWRRVLISSILATFLIYLVGYGRLPTSKETVITLFIIFIIFYNMWINYTKTVTKKTISVGIEHIDNIKMKLSEH